MEQIWPGRRGVVECSIRRHTADTMSSSTPHGSNHNSIDTIDKHWTGQNGALHPSTSIFHACRGQTEINALDHNVAPPLIDESGPDLRQPPRP